ncbi:MAG: class I tRNA ligase family protein, partial [Lachnospiraceae bacterium]|nr:class I tRNA ligase family protein [Lachnospiraceae bacterium]
DPHNDKAFADPELLKHWMPVDLYVGGPEHAVGHLMYARIWNRFLFHKGLSPVAEPFKKLVHQGMILGSNGIKMGKRFPEFVVNPTDIVREYGADTLRLYEMFMGALEASKPWSDQGVVGARKFIGRVFAYFSDPENITEEENPKLRSVYHKSVKKITHDFETLGFNTAIAQMMIFMNEAAREKCPKKYAEGFIKMFSCVCPHAGEELWSLLGHTESLACEPWPVYDEAACVDDEIEIGVQVLGKVRGTILVARDEAQESAVEKAKEVPGVARALEGKNIVKVIYVPGRILNLIAK